MILRWFWCDEKLFNMYRSIQYIHMEFKTVYLLSNYLFLYFLFLPDLLIQKLCAKPLNEFETKENYVRAVVQSNVYQQVKSTHSLANVNSSGERWQTSSSFLLLSCSKTWVVYLSIWTKPIVWLLGWFSLLLINSKIVNIQI